ncbi:MAG: DnaJ domain-containing protein [Candidatus Omnitrophica bacterium]|nr:DnaJ domain-containing protein [Candidatus Omnitrophota bacterium]
MGDKNYYKILEVHSEASEEVIKKAYQTLALRYHPDKHISTRKKWAEEKFKELSEAYYVLSDPLRRRQYDRDEYSEEAAGGADAADARAEEEAYFYYRMGLGHYQNAGKKASWRVLFGRIGSDIDKARDDLATVLDEYPDSKYAEDAFYYYLCTLDESREYDGEFLKDTEEAFDEFFDEFPRSKWAGEVKLRQGRFYLFKKREDDKAKSVLADLVRVHPDEASAGEAKILLEFVRGVKQKCGK